MNTDRLRARPTHLTFRTCVGCRRRDERSALLRVVVEQRVDGQQPVLVPDPRHRLPGRGAWLHPTPECLERAVRRRAFGRALRVKAVPSLDVLTAYLGAHEQSVVAGSPPEPVVHQTESGFDADEHPMSTQR